MSNYGYNPLLSLCGMLDDDNDGDFNENYLHLMNKLSDKLDKLGVPHNPVSEFKFSGYKMTFPWTTADVVCHDNSYNSDTCVESYRFDFDNGDVTYDSPERIAELIAKEYKKYDSHNQV